MSKELIGGVGEIAQRVKDFQKAILSAKNS